MISRLGITFPKTVGMKCCISCIAQLPFDKLIGPPRSGNYLRKIIPNAGTSAASERGTNRSLRRVDQHTSRQP